MLLRYTECMFKYEKERKKNPFLERWSLDHGGASPSLLVPCLKSTAHCTPSSPPHPYKLPANKAFINIQMTLTCLLLLGRAHLWIGCVHILMLTQVICSYLFHMNLACILMLTLVTCSLFLKSRVCILILTAPYREHKKCTAIHKKTLKNFCSRHS